MLAVRELAALIQRPVLISTQFEGNFCVFESPYALLMINYFRVCSNQFSGKLCSNRYFRGSYLREFVLLFLSSEQSVFGFTYNFF